MIYSGFFFQSALSVLIVKKKSRCTLITHFENYFLKCVVFTVPFLHFCYFRVSDSTQESYSGSFWGFFAQRKYLIILRWRERLRGLCYKIVILQQNNACAVAHVNSEPTAIIWNCLSFKYRQRWIITLWSISAKFNTTVSQIPW